MYGALAEGVLVIHAAFVLFVVSGLLLIVVGGLLSWSWVRRPLFRFVHLFAIGVVVVQAWLGVLCPLTTLENWLRSRAGQQGYQGSFIQHWLHALLYYEAPEWVFILLYSGFGFLVMLAWMAFPPRREGRHAH